MKKLVQALVKAKEWLKKRWNIESDWRFAKIFVLFAVTGSSSVWVKKLVLFPLGFTPDAVSGWIYYPVRIIVLFISYQLLFLFWGFIFCEFPFAKWFVGKMTSRFTGKKKK